MNVLVPVQYPLTDRNNRALKRAMEFIEDDPMAALTILHLNTLASDEHVTRRELRQAVEHEHGELTADYIVRDGFLVEEVILEEALRDEITHVVISESRHAKWVHSLLELLDLGVDLEKFLRSNLDVELVVVP